MDDKYYKHSGYVNPVGVGAALIVGIVAGAVLGVVYAGAVVFIPYVKLRFLLSILYGFAVGVVPAGLLKKMKVRNLRVSTAVVGAVVVFSFYISWASWESIVMRSVEGFPSFSQIAMNPKLVFHIARFTDHFGTWSMGGAEAVTGKPLLTIWFIEAICVFGTALLAARGILARLPFCEKCDQWCSGPTVVKTTAMADTGVLKSKLESGDFSYAAVLPQAVGGKFLEFTLHYCKSCSAFKTLSVAARQIRKDKQGKVHESCKIVVNKLLISSADLLTLAPQSAEFTNLKR